LWPVKDKGTKGKGKKAQKKKGKKIPGAFQTAAGIFVLFPTGFSIQFRFPDLFPYTADLAF